MEIRDGLKRLPIHEWHVKAGAHWGAFGEWEVPLYYTSILQEHERVRTRAGLFDISHMGEFFVRGPGSRPFLEEILPRRMDRLRDGKALYVPLLNEKGGVVDDLIVYQLAPEHFLLIVNAGNIEKDFRWIEARVPAVGVQLENASERKFLFALQGPQGLKIAERVFHCDFQSLRYYHFLLSAADEGELLISRTGYTGEDGLEIMGEVSVADAVWKKLIDAGESVGLGPVGFGARDTLRLEAAMPLYGHDMADDTSPLEAGLQWAVDLEKPHFVGREELVRQKETGVPRKLIGFEMKERGIPRQGFLIEKKMRALGHVTSGSFSPTLKKNIGLGYVPAGEATAGNEIEVVIRNQRLKAEIISLPFYKRRS